MMDKKTAMENLALAAYEKGEFNGAWLYAEKGRIVSKGAFGWVDAENTLPMRAAKRALIVSRSALTWIRTAPSGSSASCSLSDIP